MRRGRCISIAQAAKTLRRENECARAVTMIVMIWSSIARSLREAALIRHASPRFAWTFQLLVAKLHRLCRLFHQRVTPAGTGFVKFLTTTMTTTTILLLLLLLLSSFCMLGVARLSSNSHFVLGVSYSVLRATTGFLFSHHLKFVESHISWIKSFTLF